MITLVIPTRNRPHFLLRALSYYSDCRFGHPIVIADSSDEEHLRRGEFALKSIAGRLSVAHEVFPSDTPVLAKLSGVLDEVETPYVVLGSDDDFFVPEALGQAVRFLETHADFGLAHGEATLFGLRSGTVHGEIAWMKPYPQRMIAQETGASRLLDHLSHYTSTWYSVHRTDLLRGALRQAAPLELDYYFLEMVPSCLAVIKGKAMKMEGYYMVRQSHPGTTSSAGKGSSFDPFAWLADPGWASQYQRFMGCLRKELAKEDQIPQERAEEIVKIGFWSYLIEILSTRWERRYGRSRPVPPSPIRKMASKVPGLPNLWRWAKRSTTHSAFMPIYRAVTEGKTLIEDPPVLQEAMNSHG